MKTKKSFFLNYHGIYLLLAALLLLFSDGRLAFAPAAWLAPFFLVRYYRRDLNYFGLIFSLFTLFGTGLFCYWGLFPKPYNEASFVLICLITCFRSIPFVADYLIMRKRNNFAATLLLPAAAVLTEWLVAALGASGSWLFSAYSQVNALPTAGLLPVAGMPLITFLMFWFYSFANWAWDNRSQLKKIRFYITAVSVLYVAAGITGLLFYLLPLPEGEKIVVSGIPVASMPQHKEYQIAAGLLERELGPNAGRNPRAAAIRMEDELLSVIEREAADGASIIVLSEKAFYFEYEEEAARILERFSGIAQKYGCCILYTDEFAHVSRNQEGLEESLFSSRAILVDDQGKIAFEYRKAHRGPLEELLPGDKIIPVAQTRFGRLGAVFGLETLFPEYVSQSGRKGIDLLLVPTDGWFSDLEAGLSYPGARGVENGCPVFQVSCSGYSLASGAGRAFPISFSRSGIFRAEISLQSRQTLYPAVAPYISLFVLLLGLLSLLPPVKKKKETVRIAERGCVYD